MSIGRPTKYKEEYCQELIDFFDIDSKTKYKVQKATKMGVIEIEMEKASSLPTFAMFAKKLKVAMDTLSEWKSVYPEFSAAYKKAKSMQQAILVENAMSGDYNTAFACFFMKNCHNWADKVEQKTEVTEHKVELAYKLKDGNAETN